MVPHIAVTGVAVVVFVEAIMPQPERSEAVGKMSFQLLAATARTALTAIEWQSDCHPCSVTATFMLRLEHCQGLT